ncbi:helix-turn-helix domain-containing protein [Tenacibaculum finnmarkense]|uniref:helix-turn-helix domain-containing protein n=1 Tax=Tenacibaculum finnmarkense TaxID=2781243 RepID=UPI000C79FA39|nr:helix-turn-helix domain-containing protein [Tenacibaculum finnmarkense]MCG8763472.1 helix-turn-helix domain-containing protein [Tenacibaculum finnmarkense]MCG8788848.1 helix-turn-helix domain-containing protein [Tenacibaculum finnmarkense]SOU86815.1 putative Helix-turn-helix domain [Tenacibaculum dicentrarchi]
MDNNVVFVSVPLQEWTDIKNMVQDISNFLQQTKDNGKPENLTVKEACEFLRCSRNTFQKYIHDGDLSVIKDQNKKYSKVTVKRSELHRFVAQRSSF